jgi:hypothetical protein
MGLSVRQVRRVLRRYRESGGKLESPPLAAPVRLHVDACHQQASSPIGVTDEFGHHDPSTKQAKKGTKTLDIFPQVGYSASSPEEVLRMVSASSEGTT